MLTDRITGAFTFRKGVYAEVAKDPAFTTTAWMIVAVVQFLNQFGTRAVAGRGVVGLVVGGLIAAAFAVLAFALSVFFISWISRSLFNSPATFDELQRSLGLAQVWSVIGLFGLVGVISPALGCILAPVTLAAGIAALIAYFVALRETTGLSVGQCIVAVIVAAIVQGVVLAVVGSILAVIGLGAAAAAGSLIQ